MCPLLIIGRHFNFSAGRAQMYGRGGPMYGGPSYAQQPAAVAPPQQSVPYGRGTAVI